MDHFPRFRRSKKDAAATPVIQQPTQHAQQAATPPASIPSSTTITTTTTMSSRANSDRPKKTSSAAPGTPPSSTLSLPPMSAKPARKLSPFRGFHLRPSHKRARDSPPASLPQSPTAAVMLRESGPGDRPRTAHAEVGGLDGLVEGSDATAGERGRGRMGDGGPRIPGFLELSEKDILEKFTELVWLERNRLAASTANPSPDFRWARVPFGPHLKLLDRYNNIQPWQNNRVKLRVPDGKVDYINASPVALQPSRPDSGPPHQYIAMQGPKATSADHVWRMVAEQCESPAVIVMLTETHEANMEKCWPYFPRRREDPPLRVNAGDEFGDGWYATVRCEGLEDTPAGDAIELRKLVVRVQRKRRGGKGQTNGGGEKMNGKRSGDDATPEPVVKVEDGRDAEEDGLDAKVKSPTADIREGISMLGSERRSSPLKSGTATPTDEDEPEGEVDERIVYHFIYKRWPDFGVPALEDLESFFTLMRLSQEKNASRTNPRIVHCSAGVGRSGTFIALEHLMRELDAGVLEDWDEDGGKKDDGEVLPDAGGGEETREGDEDEGGAMEGEDLIFNTVNALREQRRTMVQAEPQYLFIYQVMRKLWMDKYGAGGEGNGEPAAKRLEVDPFVG